MAEVARQRIRSLLDDLDQGCAEAIPAAAGLVLNAIESGGVVHAAGAGHSLAMVCETFYRAGGLAAVRPLWEPAVLPLTGALRSTDAEREFGRGRALVQSAAPVPPDVMVVFSTSGRNPYPVEIAKEARARDVPVLAVTSLPASAEATDRAGSRLADHATIVLDTGVPPGDVVYPGEEPRTCAVSTILGAYLWSMLLARLHDLADERGVRLPVWTSSNVPGGDERNADLLARYGERIPELATLR
ncbi:SIS domain-containing protein [Amycolatopsis aidingensis]|uniref:SIS domain-containing protein n=1 Tax=Amycolatopsis aidingensis TaxID=2842453 RepID=UPI001C0BDF5F|nr:SIS domain-containing protein [Amycolatopsis aidingensis]